MLGFALSVLIAGFLFVPGPRLRETIKTFARRIAAERGAYFVDLAGATIRNISRGVIRVALFQAILVGLGQSFNAHALRTGSDAHFSARRLLPQLPARSLPDRVGAAIQAAARRR